MNKATLNQVSALFKAGVHLDGIFKYSDIRVIYRRYAAMIHILNGSPINDDVEFVIDENQRAYIKWICEMNDISEFDESIDTYVKNRERIFIRIIQQNFREISNSKLEEAIVGFRHNMVLEIERQRAVLLKLI